MSNYRAPKSRASKLYSLDPPTEVDPAEGVGICTWHATACQRCRSWLENSHSSHIPAPILLCSGTHRAQDVGCHWEGCVVGLFERFGLPGGRAAKVIDG